jgi:hypothetical protein
MALAKVSVELIAIYFRFVEIFNIQELAFCKKNSMKLARQNTQSFASRSFVTDQSGYFTYRRLFVFLFCF